jgi:hypothetical protein
MMGFRGLGGVFAALLDSPNLEFMHRMAIRFRGHADETMRQQLHPGAPRSFWEVLHLVSALFWNALIRFWSE